MDDDLSVREVLKEIVTTYGFSALLAISVKEAASTLVSQKVYVILLDLSMPDIMGDQFLSLIRKKGFGDARGIEREGLLIFLYSFFKFAFFV